MLSKVFSKINLTAGTVFWYKYKNKVYGGIILCVKEDIGYAFIAVSEQISYCGKAPNIDEIMNSPLYTAAWFDRLNLLPHRQFHIIGRVCITGDFSNRAGLKISNGRMSLTNIGGKETWRHKYWSFRLREHKLSDSVNASLFPRTM